MIMLEEEIDEVDVWLLLTAFDESEHLQTMLDSDTLRVLHGDEDALTTELPITGLPPSDMFSCPHIAVRGGHMSTYRPASLPLQLR
jgi:hypothetical protein